MAAKRPAASRLGAKATQGVSRVGATGLQLYAGIDAKNAGVAVVIDGVPYQTMEGGKPVQAPAPTGPATVRVSYALNISNPDVKTLKPGSF